MKTILRKGCATLIWLALLLNSVTLAEEKHVWATQGDVAFFTENGKIGLQTLSGEVLHEAAFDKASYFDESGQANVFIGNKTGRIDSRGRMVVEPFECDLIWLLGTGLDQILVFEVGRTNFLDAKNRWGFLSLDGKLLSEAKWHNIHKFRNGFTYAKMEDIVYEIDMQGNITKDEGWKWLSDNNSLYGRSGATETEVTALNPCGEKIATFNLFPNERGSGTHTLGGRIYLNGQVYEKDDWSHFKWLSEGRYAFQQNKKWGVVDQEMNEISPLIWEYIYNNHTPALYWDHSREEHTPEEVWLVSEDGYYYGWMDTEGELIVEPIYANIAPVGENLWLAGTNDLSGNPTGDHLVLNEKGEVVRTIPESVGTAVSYGEGYIRYYQNETGDWGFMNTEGEILSRFSGALNLYDSDTVSEGRIRIWETHSEEGSIVGYADVYGNIISSPEWKTIHKFSHGFAVVEIEDGLRYIDYEGKVVGGEEWDFISDYFFTGSQWIAQVGNLNEAGEMEHGYINDQGEPICEINLKESQLTD